MAQAVLNLCVNRKVFLKYQVGKWNKVGSALQDQPWHNIWSADNPVKVLNEHMSLLDGRCVPSKVDAGALLTLSRRLIFGGLVIALGLIGMCLLAVKLELMQLTRRPSICLVSETGMSS